MRYPFLESLDGILEEVFGILHPQYVGDQAAEVRRELERQISAEYETRYVLIDGATGQLETRTFFESPAEAEKWAKDMSLESYTVGTLLVEVLGS